MSNPVIPKPDNTAIRTALWRALHVLADDAPHVLEDTMGLQLAGPAPDWRSRQDMSHFTKPFRASIIARARFIEDIVLEQAAKGLGPVSGKHQYVILGAGLDTLALRHPELADRINIFEIDQPAAQTWKQQRMAALGIATPPNLHFVPVDFETGDSWWDKLVATGFDMAQPAFIVSTGVSMYLSREANMATLRQVAKLAPGSTFVMSFILPIELVDADIRFGVEQSIKGAKASGTPMVSFFTQDEAVAMASVAGFRQAQHISSGWLAERYFADRKDGFRPPNHAEELVVART
jgi:methyltransferase (TIGR00027 family)